MAEYIPGVDFQAAIEKCELCQEEDAQFYCKDCRQEMCSGCTRSHLRSQVSLNHNIISSNLGKSNIKERKPIKCSSHPREIIRIYCTNCDEAVCVKCISGTKHKNHNFDELQTTLYRYQDEVSQSTPKSVDSVVSSAVNTISTDIVTKINPGVNCFRVSAVNDKEAWCGDDNFLVLIDIDGHIKKEIKLKRNLMDVAVTSKGEVFVTESLNKYINKYLTDGKCINISYTLPCQPQGLCVTSQDDLLVCLYNDDDDNKVVRMTTNGYIKQTIQKDKQHQPLFTDPSYVTENINGDVVVVDDNYSATIVVVNKEGEHRYNYPDSSHSSHTIGKCYGIACDNTGCILVSDNGNHRIHQLDINGRFLQFILTEQHRILEPCGLSIDVKGQLWLGNNDGREVTIFKYRS